MDRDDRPWFRRPGWVVSAILHGGIVALTFFSWPTPIDETVQPDFVPVELLEIADTTNVKASAKSDDPKPEPKPAAKPDPKPKAAPNPKPEPPPPPPPEPEPEPVAEPEPAPAPEPAPEVAEAEPEPAPSPDPVPAPPTPRAKPKDIKEPPKEVAEAEPEPTPAPEKKPEKPKKDDPPPEDDKPFDPDSVIAGLEDKEDTDTTTDSAPEEQPSEDDKPQQGIGDPSRATATIQDAFKTQVSKCWSPPVGAPSPESLIVRLRVRLNRDGSLAGMPEYLETGKMGDPYYRAAAEAARRAIMGCQNYKLPTESYDLWKDFDVNFDPTTMLGL